MQVGIENLSAFTDDARVWIFALSESAPVPVQEELLSLLSEFFVRWKAHGSPVRGGASVVDNTFLLVVANEDSGVSGCGIDSMVQSVHEVVEKVSMSLAEPSEIFVKNNEEVQRLSRKEFKNLVKSGDLDHDSLVYDTTLCSLDALRKGQLLRPIATSWHARLL